MFIIVFILPYFIACAQAPELGNNEVANALAKGFEAFASQQTVNAGGNSFILNIVVQKGAAALSNTSTSS